jgi:hypothetical protein
VFELILIHFTAVIAAGPGWPAAGLKAVAPVTATATIAAVA